MIDLLPLLKNTVAYNIVKSERDKQMLSHAYLFITSDGEMLAEYLKLFARLMACKEDQPCGVCRTCRLIASGGHSDVLFYPKKAGAVLADDINSIIEESFLRPIETDKKIFIISDAHTMNVSAQNKLLKTLEEPPRGVHIILGATSEFTLLPTIKSRVKKLEIPAFSDEQIFCALKDEYPDEQRLKRAIRCCGGAIGKAVALYGDETLKDAYDLALDVLINMQSSKDVLLFSTKIANAKFDFSQFLSILELLLRDILMIRENQSQLVFDKDKIDLLNKAERFNTGATLHALECIVEANRRKKFNTNATMLIEWLLFQILEGKYKWQKS